MDWELAIRRNRDDLLKIIAMIFMTIGLMPGAVVATLPRRVYYAAMRILRPAESAVRRVIFMGMRGIDACRSMSRVPSPRPARAIKAARAVREARPRLSLDRHSQDFR